MEAQLQVWHCMSGEAPVLILEHLHEAPMPCRLTQCGLKSRLSKKRVTLQLPAAWAVWHDCPINDEMSMRGRGHHDTQWIPYIQALLERYQTEACYIDFQPVHTNNMSKGEGYLVCSVPKSICQPWQVALRALKCHLVSMEVHDTAGRIFNLLPWRYQERRARLRRWIMGYCICMVLSGLLEFLIRVNLIREFNVVGQHDHMLAKQHQTLLKQAAAHETLSQTSAQLTQALNRWNSLVSHRAQDFRLLQMLAQSIPSNLYLTKVAWQRGILTLVGVSRQQDAVRDWMAVLKQFSGFEKRVDVEQVDSPKVPAGYFEVKLQTK